MPIGKDSITKRVAKTTADEKNIAPELVATTAAAPAANAPAKKTTAKKATTTKTSAAKPTTKAPAKKPVAKKEPAKEAITPAEEKTVETAVLTNVAPETVAAVIGHKEDEKYEKVQIGQKMPDFLL